MPRVRPHRQPLTTARRSRLFLPTLIAFILTLTLMLGSMWLTVGRVQQIGSRHYAVGAEAGRLAIGITTANTNAPTRWIAESYGFLFEPWFEIERSPRVVAYASVPLWAPLLVLGYLAWRTRPRRILPGHCHHCGYDLGGINPCPECGRPS
jgi:hypothetical protein